MGEKWDDRKFNDVARLIREEEQTALETFRKGNFDQRLRALTADFPEKRGSGIFSRRILIQAAAAIFLLILAGAVLLIRHRPVRDTDRESGRFTAILAGLPGLSEWAARRDARSPGELDVPGVARSIREVLISGELGKANEARNISPSAVSLKVPRLSLEKKMTILFREKVIERVLVSIHKKSEEV
jgi:hypothetical protein